MIVGETILQLNKVFFEKRLCIFNGFFFFRIPRLNEQVKLDIRHLQLTFFNNPTPYPALFLLLRK